MSTPLQTRMSHPGQKRILTLDGGGIRGIISVEILQKIEDLLRKQSGGDENFVLADYFDLIAGTSTGAIIAAALSIGLSVAELRKFYYSAGPTMFTHDSLWHLWKNKYTDHALKEELQAVFGADTLLGSHKLRPLLMVTLQNVTTDQAWTVSNNPNCRFNRPDRPDSHLNLPLWQVVRASTAAPTFFPPEKVAVGAHEFVFVDGSVSSYTNPSFQAFLRATAPAFDINWPTGENQLLLVSVGTGLGVHRRNNLKPEDLSLLDDAREVPAELILSTVVEQDTLCRTFGNCLNGHELDKEVGNLVSTPAPGGANLFTYLRYNEELTEEGLARLGLAGIDPESVQRLDSIDHLDDLMQIGRAIAAQQVRAEHFASFPPDKGIEAQRIVELETA